MQITAKTEYALRALAELADRVEEGPVSLRTVAQRQKLPLKYVEQLFRQLKKGQLVTSRSGAMGGYQLGKPPSQISLNDVMQAVDEASPGTPCRADGRHASFCLGLPCVYHEFWNEISGRVSALLSSVTLADLLARLQAAQNKEHKNGQQNLL